MNILVNVLIKSHKKTKNNGKFISNVRLYYKNSITVSFCILVCTFIDLDSFEVSQKKINISRLRKLRLKSKKLHE